MKAALFAGLALVACNGSDPVSTSADARPHPIPEDDAATSDVDAMSTSPDAGPAASGIAACDGLELTRELTLMPAPVGVRYLRCETRGTETGRGVVWAPDGTKLAVLTTAGTVRLFSTQPWAELAQLAAPIGRIETVAFSPDSARLATFSAEMGEVTLWRAGDGVRDRSFDLVPADMMNTYASSMAFSSDGHKLAVSSYGSVIDLTSGVVTTAPFGHSVLQLAFAPGDGVVFVDNHFQVGNSPTSEGLVLVDLATGTSTLLFSRYDRALLGYALSPDASLIAFTATEESGDAGLFVHRTTDGAELVSDATIADTVVAFTHDNARLITLRDHRVRVLDASDLHLVTQFDLPATPFQIAGVSPEDELVVASDGHTNWWSLDTGEMLQTLPRWIDHAAWSADGLYGAGTGPGPFFVLWNESDLVQLCKPEVMTGESAAIGALGTLLLDEQTVTTQDGSTTAESVFYLHGHATNYYAVHVTDNATTAEVRVFAPSSSRSLVVGQPDGARLYTKEGSALDAAGWCR